LNFKVKGIGVSNFNEKEVEFLQKNGNEEARKIWLANFDPKSQKVPDSKDAVAVKNFIKAKYQDKKYAEKSGKTDKEKKKDEKEKDKDKDKEKEKKKKDDSSDSDSNNDEKKKDKDDKKTTKKNESKTGNGKSEKEKRKKKEEEVVTVENKNISLKKLNIQNNGNLEDKQQPKSSSKKKG